MTKVTVKNFDAPDEKRTPDKTTLHVVDLGSAKAARLEAQPGWRWSECIKPVVGTESCQVEHIGYMLAGALHVEHADGTKCEVKAGAVYRIAPGHDAWVVGDEPAVVVEFQGAASYAKA